jgi:hypothetical protein
MIGKQQNAGGNTYSYYDEFCFPAHFHFGPPFSYPNGKLGRGSSLKSSATLVERFLFAAA